MIHGKFENFKFLNLVTVDDVICRSRNFRLSLERSFQKTGQSINCGHLFSLVDIKKCTKRTRRGAVNLELGTSEEELLSIMGGTLKVNGANSAMIRPFSERKMSAFQARCDQET